MVDLGQYTHMHIGNNCYMFRSVYICFVNSVYN